jgi:hypothetical protein
VEINNDTAVTSIRALPACVKKIIVPGNMPLNLIAAVPSHIKHMVFFYHHRTMLSTISQLPSTVEQIGIIPQSLGEDGGVEIVQKLTRNVKAVDIFHDTTLAFVKALPSWVCKIGICGYVQKEIFQALPATIGIAELNYYTDGNCLQYLPKSISCIEIYPNASFCLMHPDTHSSEIETVVECIPKHIKLAVMKSNKTSLFCALMSHGIKPINMPWTSLQDICFFSIAKHKSEISKILTEAPGKLSGDLGIAVNKILQEQFESELESSQKNESSGSLSPKSGGSG